MSEANSPKYEWGKFWRDPQQSNSRGSIMAQMASCTSSEGFCIEPRLSQRIGNQIKFLNFCSTSWCGVKHIGLKIKFLCYKYVVNM